MPRKLPPHVERNRVKGKNYYSFRKGKGPRIRLPDDPTSEEFRVAYASAMAGEPRPTIRVDQAGTISALIGSYMRSAGFVKLRDTSKKGYMTRLEAIRIAHGSRSVAGLTRERTPRCKAKSKRTGKRCRAPAVRGCRVCRMHGAGGGAPTGKQNGNYRHGRRTNEAIQAVRYINFLSRLARKS